MLFNVKLFAGIFLEICMNNQILAIKSKQKTKSCSAALFKFCSDILLQVMFWHCCNAACRVNSRGPVLHKKKSFGAYHQSYAKLKSLDNESVVTKHINKETEIKQKQEET